MDKKNILPEILAILGSILVWLTLVAPVFFWLLFAFRRGVLALDHFDYLIPAELFPLALAGGGLLVWAAMRARKYIKLVVGSLSLAIVALFSGQLLAVLTGLATGETKPGGWQWAVVLGAIGIYILALVGLGVGGILLSRGRVKPVGQE